MGSFFVPFCLDVEAALGNSITLCGREVNEERGGFVFFERLQALFGRGSRLPEILTGPRGEDILKDKAGKNKPFV